jgi:hypothetical protein
VREDAVGHYDDLLARRDASFGRAQRAAHRRDAPREPGPRNWVPHRYLEVLSHLHDPLAGENLARHEDHRTATVVAQHGLGDERERDERLPGPRPCRRGSRRHTRRAARESRPSLGNVTVSGGPAPMRAYIERPHRWTRRGAGGLPGDGGPGRSEGDGAALRPRIDQRTDHGGRAHAPSPVPHRSPGQRAR